MLPVFFSLILSCVLNEHVSISWELFVLFVDIDLIVVVVVVVVVGVVIVFIIVAVVVADTFQQFYWCPGIYEVFIQILS